MPKKRSQSRRRPQSTTPRTEDLLFEIGTEELPAAYLPSLIQQLSHEAAALLEANALTYGAIKSFGTPRRLVLLTRGLAGVQRKPAEEIRGPSRQVCYDASGRPTPALLGFLRSRNGTLDQTKVVSSEKGDYLYLIKPPTETPTATVLPGLLPQLITRLHAPKTMRWDGSGVRFARPIRWVFALYGSKPVQFTFGALKSRPWTWVGAPLRPKRLAVSSIEGYFKQLDQQKVAIDLQKRQQQIAEAVTNIARTAGGIIPQEMLSHGLLDEVACLVETPVTLTGSFDTKYLELPREVLLVSMAKHQRVFVVENPPDNRLLPRWIAVLEGKPGKPDAVRAVIERILNARLADSLLFWNEDRKRPFEQMRVALSGVTFHEKLGTMADKTTRLEALAERLIALWKGRIDEKQERHIRQAAQLAKTDLVTYLVREFPSLQGTIGKRLLLESRDGDPDVASALEQQYWLQEPSEEQQRRHANQIPGGIIGLALTIIEKYDTLASYFGIGIEPTGNADPFGLRPHAQGIVAAAKLLPQSFSLPLTELFRARASFPPFKTMSDSERDRVALRVKDYIFERLYTTTRVWKESSDVINAVIASRDNDDLVDVMKRIQMLHALKHRRPSPLVKPAKIIERTGNILKAASAQPKDGVDSAWLQEPLEQQLYTLYESKREQFAHLVEQKSYDEATTLFGETFYAPLHDFFDKVMVNVPDELLRQNRLALMQAIHTLYTGRIADLSKLTIVQREESV